MSNRCKGPASQSNLIWTLVVGNLPHKCTEWFLESLTYALAIVVVPSAAMLGCWRSAVRAAAANPVDAIRSE